MELSLSSNASVIASLLILNNDCLMDIFQFLEVDDHANLAKVCQRLREVSVHTRIFRTFKIEIHDSFNSNYKQLIPVNKFVDILESIGEQIMSLSLTINSINDISSILEIVRRHCQNLKKIELNAFEDYTDLTLDFTNLTELKFDVSLVSVNKLKNCIANNIDLESITFTESLPLADLQEYAVLLEPLPKLSSFSFAIDYFASSGTLQYFNILDRLTRITIECGTNCDELLFELAIKSIVEELDISAEISANTFDIIKAFKKLKTLRVANLPSKPRGYYDETTILPQKLKRFEIARFKMSKLGILQIIEQLTFLEELNVFFCKFSDYCRSPEEFSLIWEELRVNLGVSNRILKIYIPGTNSTCESNQHLKVLNYPREEIIEGVIKNERAKLKIAI